MKDDIKNNIEILKYPVMEEFNDLNEEQIIELIKGNNNFVKKYTQDLQYFIGKNVSILEKCNIDKDNPDSRITVPYSRTMVQVVKGYMYKPGLITYHSDDEGYLERLLDVFEINEEELVTSENGENQCKYGNSIELLYVDQDDETNKSVPMFSSIDPREVVLIYGDYIKEKLIGAVRYYVISRDDTKQITKLKIEVYYKDRIDTFTVKRDDVTDEYKDFTQEDSYDNFFKDIPFVVYKNNTERHADYHPVKALIDSYDVLSSDAINELNRFASAYLVLKNFILSNIEDENEKSQELARMKTRRVIELFEDGDVTFLTKDIPSEFFESIKQTIREDIEYHSHIPDFRSRNFQAKSGAAMMWSLFDFENLCGDKQAQFEKGLRRRIMLINNFFSIKAIDAEKVEIKFERNVPTNQSDKIKDFVMLASSNKISDEDLLKMLPSDIIDDVEGALERINKQKEENMEMFSFEGVQDDTNSNESGQSGRDGSRTQSGNKRLSN